jgi:hypothetical protein
MTVCVHGHVLLCLCDRKIKTTSSINFLQFDDRKDEFDENEDKKVKSAHFLLISMP